MKSVSVSVAKNSLSALLREVRRGNSVTITDRGVPVATLTPALGARRVPARILDLARRGIVTLPRRAPTTDWLDLPLPKLSKGKSVVAALIEERESGW
jgi:prevent-host-death family protein